MKKNGIASFLLICRISMLHVLLAHGVQGLAAESEELAFDAGLIAAELIVEKQGIADDERGRKEIPTQKMDLRFRRIVHGEAAGEQETSKEKAFRDFSDVGVVALVGGSIGSWLLGDHAGSELVPVHAYLMTNLVTSSLKYAVHRQRPRAFMGVEGELSEDDISSFPSGHASNAFTAARLIANSLGRNRIWVAPLAYGMATAVAFGRIAADRHYLSDTLVGGVIGYSAVGAADFVGRSLWVNQFSVTVHPRLVSVRYRW